MYLTEKNDYVLRIGRTGENEFSTFEFDVSAWVDEYPSGEIVCVYRRPDNEVYPVVIQRLDNVILWTATAMELTVAGNGELQFWIMDGDVIGKSKRIQCVVTEALDPGDTPPTPGMDWIAQTIKDTSQAAQEARVAKEELLAAAERGDFDGPPGNIDEDKLGAMINDYLEKHPLAGIPDGGKAGQILRKKSDEDYDTEWADFEIPEQYGLVTYDQNKTITIS